ncbi:hypothetical protein RDABS01_006006, partial [Bienertia sinuspersici]
MVVTRIRGTRGYLAPEWILEKGVSTKSDVYSYGMLLLEMIGGRRNVLMSSGEEIKGKAIVSDTKTWEYFPKTVVEKMKAGSIMEVVDRRLLEEGTVIDENDVRRLVCIALWCIQEKVQIRPNMGQVVSMLEGRLPVDEPPKTEMFLHDLLLIKTEKTRGWNKIMATAMQLSESPNKSPTAATTSSILSSALEHSMLPGKHMRSQSQEAKKSKIFALILVVTLISLVTVSALYLGRSWEFFAVFSACIIVIFAVFIWLIRHRSKGSAQILPQKQVQVLSRELSVPCSFLRKVAGVPTKFRQKELELATDNFNSLIGRGASGAPERGEKEFLAEVAAIGSNVWLLHFPDGPRFLVYEFIQNGSLDGWIFPRRDKRELDQGMSSMALRYGVAVDVAKALSYLHSDCRSRILHLDVKPENILLDDNYRAVVSDFGLAKLMGRDESRIVTNIRGTKGYLAPEWLLENGISAKSDVYSYGMVLLEMIGGRRSVRVLDDNKDRSLRKYEYFPKVVVQKMKEGKIMSVVDQRLLEGRHIDERQVRNLVCIALWCIQEKPRRRPTMTQVVDMLEGHLHVDEPPETEMIIVDLLSIGKGNTHGKGRLKATGVVLSDCNTATSSSAFEAGT